MNEESAQFESTALQTKTNYFITPTRLNADNSNKRAVFLFWLIFALFELTVLITSNFTPYAFIFKTNQSQLSNTNHSECLNPMEFENGILSCSNFSLKNPKLGLIMRNLSPMNQFAQINLLFLPKNGTIKQEFKAELMSLKRKQIAVNQNKKAIVFEKGEDVKILDSFTFDSLQYQIQQLKWSQESTRTGYEVRIGYYREFKSEDALLVITFLNLQPSYLENFEIKPQAILMNSSYTIFVIVMRAVFLGITTLTFALYLKNIRKYPSSFEQKVVFVLSGLVLFFNDPYYFIQVFKPNVFCLFLSTLFLSTFFIAVILSWICLLQRIKTTINGQSFELTLSKKLRYAIISTLYFVIIFWFIFEISYYSFSQSPIIPFHSTFSNLYRAIIVLFTLVFLYLAWLYFSIIKEWGSLSWRDKIYCTFNIFFILLNLVFISLGWFSFYDESSQKFQIFYASMNFYVLYLQYMYSPPFLQSSKQTSPEQLSLVLEQEEVKAYITQECITIDLQEKEDRQVPDIKRISVE